MQADLARIAAARSQRRVYPIERIQKQIPPDAALIFWIDIASPTKQPEAVGNHWGCVIRSQGPPTWIGLPGSGANGGWIASDYSLLACLRDALKSQGEDWSELAHKIAAQRLKPLETAFIPTATLPNVKHLVAIPWGPMAGVPLEVLTEKYTVSYAPSATIYAFLAEQQRPLRQLSLLAIGAPEFAPSSKARPTPPDSGILVMAASPSSRAFKAGLRGGDVLLRYGASPLNCPTDLKALTSAATLELVVWREGQVLSIRLLPDDLNPASVVVSSEPVALALPKRWELDAMIAGLPTHLHTWPPPLRFSHLEVTSISKLFPASKVITATQASEQELNKIVHDGQLKHFGVVHLATHGYIHATNPTLSELQLALDRRLLLRTIQEKWDLDNADLVTLSACETAMGVDGGGEGYIGFSQVLFAKGTRSLLLSLWEVDDLATTLLMVRFYENWLGSRPSLTKPMPKADALAEAKQWLRQLTTSERNRWLDEHRASNNAEVKRELHRGERVKPVTTTPINADTQERPYAHPKYWAAFVLIGDSR